MHVAEADWDAAPALSYLEQLQMLAKDAGLPAYVNNAGVAPLPKLLMQVRSHANAAFDAPTSCNLLSCS